MDTRNAFLDSDRPMFLNYIGEPGHSSSSPKKESSSTSQAWFKDLFNSLYKLDSFTKIMTQPYVHSSVLPCEKIWLNTRMTLNILRCTDEKNQSN